MSLSLSLVADLLVSILLVATIVSSWRLSSRMTQLKADETGMRSAVTELLVATDSAERAIAMLRATVAESERSLGERLHAAEHCSALLARQISAGDAVMTRVAAISDLTRQAVGSPPRPHDPKAVPQADIRPLAAEPPRRVTPPDDPRPARDEGHGLKAMVLAARQLAERTQRRVDGRAA